MVNQTVASTLAVPLFASADNISVVGEPIQFGAQEAACKGSHSAPSPFAGPWPSPIVAADRAISPIRSIVAAILSLIETAKLNGFDPEAYLRIVLTRIADHPINKVDEFLPWNVEQVDDKA